MDFSFTSDQQDLRELAAKILSDATTLERTKQVVADERRLRPRPVGSARRRRHRRHLAARVGRRRRARLPRDVHRARRGRSHRRAGPGARGHGPRRPGARGVRRRRRASTASPPAPASSPPRSPSRSATRTHRPPRPTGGKLTGEKVCVPAGSTPSAIVVSAIDGIYLVDPSAPGVTVEREDTMHRRARRAPRAERRRGDASSPVPRALTWLLERAQTAMTRDDGRRLRRPRSTSPPTT